MRISDWSSDVCSSDLVHPEPFTVVARKDANIKTFEDLKGKRVNVGNPGSVQRGTMEVVMKAMGWKMSDFDLASELQSAEQAAPLCDNKIDTFVFTVGHLHGSLEVAATTPSITSPQVKHTPSH